MQKKYDTFYGVVIKIGFQVNRRQRGTIKKKGSIKVCEFDCCIKITRDRQHVCLCTNLFNKAKSSIAHDRQ